MKTSTETPVVKLTSDSRWRASADERRRYGGNTVTEFFADVIVGGARKLVLDARDRPVKVVGYGPTPGERGTFAKNVVLGRLASGEWHT